MFRIVIVLVGTSLGGYGCSVSESTAASEAAVSRLRALLDAGKVDEMHAMAAQGTLAPNP